MNGPAFWLVALAPIVVALWASSAALDFYARYRELRLWKWDEVMPDRGSMERYLGDPVRATARTPRMIFRSLQALGTPSSDPALVALRRRMFLRFALLIATWTLSFIALLVMLD